MPTDVFDRQTVTTTVWTCSRCGGIEHIPGVGQPKWTAVSVANPPRHAEPTAVAVLCKRCDEDLADFLSDTTGDAAAKRREFRAAIEGAEQ